VRELLFNVVKHAGTKRATLELSAEDEQRLRVRVADRGRGFDTRVLLPSESGTPSRLGLFGIGERMTLLGGRLDVESDIDSGTRVTLVAPRRDSTS